MPKSVKQIKRMQHTENDRIFYSKFEVDELKEKLKEKAMFLMKEKSWNKDGDCLEYDNLEVISIDYIDSVFDEVTKK